MTIIVAPKSALAPTRPSVGIFWRVNGVLVIDRSTLDEAEPYGECITHTAGHYERSQEWDAIGGARGLRPRAIPIVSHRPSMTSGRAAGSFTRPTRRSVIYADRRLHQQDIIYALKTAFGLTESELIVRIRSDSHYR